MISHRGIICLRGFTVVLMALALLAAGAIWLGIEAGAQEVPAQTQPVAPTEEALNPTSKPGFIDAFGRWLEEGRNKFESDMKGAHEKMGEFHNKVRENTKDAAGAIAALPIQRIIQGHERCEVAVNGAPDCRNAATALCKGKGFQTGKSLDTQAEEKCPARVLLLGRTPAAGECKTETFVTRAACQ